MNSNEGKNRFILSFSLLILGILTILLSLFVSVTFLSLFSGDGHLDPLTVANIKTTRRCLFFIAITLILLGYSSYYLLKYNLKLRIPSIGKISWLISLIWLLTIVELVLSVNPLPSYQITNRTSPTYEPSAFSQHRFSKERKELYNYRNGSLKRILSHGFSRDSFRIQKPKDVFRIFIVGGSHVYDPNASIPRGDWVSLAEELLKEKGVKNIEIINSGVPGWRSFDSIGRIISELHYYDPDYIVFCHTYNDLKYFGWASPSITPFYNIPALKEKQPKQPKGIAKLFDHSQAYLRIKRMSKRSFKQAEDMDFYYGKDTLYAKISPYALQQFAINVESFVAICNITGIKPILTTQPRKITDVTIDSYRQKESNGMKFTTTKLPADVLLETYESCDSIIKRVAQKYQIPIIDLADQCSGDASEFRDIIHYANGGGSCAAKLLADFFLENIREMK